jgi:LPXTG-motif cell wall-anchored protein
MEEEPAGSGSDTALPAEVITYADLHPEEDDGGGGVELWMFPLAGVVLAGAGVLTLRRRR